MRWRRATMMAGAAWWGIAHLPQDVAAATRLAVVGDLGAPSSAAYQVAGMVGSASWNPDYVVALGDLNYGSTQVGSADWETRIGSLYGQFMQGRSGPGPNPYPLQTSPTQRFFPTPGNHDRGALWTNAGYVDYFHTDPGNPAGRLPTGVHNAAASYYSVELPIAGGAGKIALFALDSQQYDTAPEERAAQIAFVRDGLRDSTATWKFVILHYPPFSSGVHGSNEGLELPFQQWGADAVLSGHDHVYERLQVTDRYQNGMLYFVNGLGGASLYSLQTPVAGSVVRYNDSYGAMQVDVTDATATFAFFGYDESTPNGVLVDSIQLVKATMPTPPVVTADFDGSGAVGAPDLAIWRSNFAGVIVGDANADGLNDGADFLKWQREASLAGQAGATAAVPEPCSGALVVLAAGGASLAVRRRMGLER